MYFSPSLPFFIFFSLGFPGGSAGKESTCNAGDLGSIPGLGRSPGERKGYPLQYSGLENSMDCIVHGAAKSQTGLSNFDFTLSLHFPHCPHALSPIPIIPITSLWTSAPVSNWYPFPDLCPTPCSVLHAKSNVNSQDADWTLLSSCLKHISAPRYS